MVKYLPNLLSLARAFMGLVIPQMICSSYSALHAWAALVFTLAAITDYFDGWLARKLAVTSETGKWLDPLADKVLTLGCLWAFSAQGLIPGWGFWLVLVREVLVTFCRTGWGLSGVTLGAELAGKGKLVLQVFWISVCFFLLFRLDGFAPFAGDFGRWIAPTVIVSTLASVLLTWYSGFLFLRNNRNLFMTPFFAKFTLAAGVGLLPKAPGTWGSLLAVLIAIPMKENLILYWAVFFLIGWIAYFYWARFGAGFSKDPSFFVLDEVCGIFVTFALVSINWSTAVAGFLLFRAFDIWKPFPARKFESLPGYWGIMMDDLMAGVYAAVVLWLLPL
ncbi:MAG TPA: phosphatidylglycerophosphatase A [Candidatus Omnitrophota bacterium]|nr:phosphatidylglycerophosphatase A [Candidatus Omnitrophota bacterium]